MKVIEKLGRRLIEQNQSITAAESLTAGMFVSQLANVSGISAILSGSFITYSAEAKEQLIGVSVEMIERYGVVSPQVAKAMARGAQQELNTNWAIGLTGVAGPEALEGHQAGTVYIGIAQPNGLVTAKLYQLTGDRMAVREQAVACGAQLILDLMTKNVTKS
ncbi:nicotinamide-nucleotide amidohydrolase family protein [Weissella coleopterorum]|uniref:Nicotinamide-nucleotide amidohydrolase family protein n=1 Tax=Weissella coleopterorum TaxID=2714949 RepID=A0A6G8B1A6_9LACO|nr:nicotinamide-nucleotide amidohydrolase family protein [Weissella coleopterorum]QIL50913.1 nicotinamide-nucleotide amidohydrolase family protein [Weissella coleopterorum]